MRSGQLTEEDCVELDKRLLTSLPPIDAETLSRTQFIVQRNSLRVKLNDQLELSACRTQRRVGVVVLSEDVITATNEAPNQRLQQWIDTHGTAAQVGQLQRRTLYYIGQQVRFTQNICPEFGIANGSLGEIVGIHLDPEDNHVEHDEDGNVVPRTLPVLILVKVPTLDSALHEQFGVGIVPIKPVVAHGTLNVKPANSQERINIRYSRTAFPLIPTRCITDYKAQGSGFENVVLDLDYPPAPGRSDFGLAVYVMLSRALSLSGLRVLRPFNHAKLQTPFPSYVRDEWNRMCSLSHAFLHTNPNLS